MRRRDSGRSSGAAGAGTQQEATNAPGRGRAHLARRAFVGVSLLGTLGGYAWLAFVWLYRPDASDGIGAGESALTWLSLMMTTFLPHAGMGLALGMTVCVLLRMPRVAVLGAPLLACSLGPWLWSFVPRGEANAAAAGAESMLVMSANLLASTRSDEALLAQIAEHRPDVILVQEVRESSAERLRATLGAEYALVSVPRDDNFGQAILSRLPLTREGAAVDVGVGERLPQLMTFVEFGGREVCLWNIHLMSPLDLERGAEQAVMAWQLGAPLDQLAAEGAPVIVGGDFNGPWRSQPLDALRRRGFRQANREAGRGPGATWPRITMLKHLPGITLDHIAHSPGLVCTDAWTGEDTGSDHKPIFARFAWR